MLINREQTGMDEEIGMENRQAGRQANCTSPAASALQRKTAIK
jgi:hypothetical protein